MAWLLDTNVLSELRRLRPEPKVLAFISSQSLDQFYISAVTLAELRFGIELLGEGSRRHDELNHWLAHKIRPMFEQRVFQVTEAPVEGSGGGGSESGPHVFPAGSDHRRYRAAPRPHGSYP